MRTDNAAEFLRTLQLDPWFAETYDVVAVRRDPFADREFGTYKKKTGSQ